VFADVILFDKMFVIMRTYLHFTTEGQSLEENFSSIRNAAALGQERLKGQSKYIIELTNNIMKRRKCKKYSDN
jgi:hypothetical protein